MKLKIVFLSLFLVTQCFAQLNNSRGKTASQLGGIVEGVTVPNKSFFDNKIFERMVEFVNRFESETINAEDFGDKTSATIDLAIAAIDSGVVFLSAGTWDVSTFINLKSRVQLVGAGVGVTILDRANFNTSNAGILLIGEITNGDGEQDSLIVVKNLTIQGHARNSAGYTEFEAGIKIQGGSKIWIENVEIRGVGGDGILIAKQSKINESIWIINCVIEVPLVTSSPDTLVGRNGIAVTGGKDIWIVGNHIIDGGIPGGIDIEPTAPDSIENVHILNNIVTSQGSASAGVGILLTETSESATIKRIFVKGNDVSNYNIGIRTTNPDSIIIIRNNVVHHNATWGILITGSDNVVVDGNNSYRNTTIGIEISANQEYITINNNIAERNGGTGFVIWGGSGTESRFVRVTNNLSINNSQTSSGVSRGFHINFSDSLVMANNVAISTSGDSLHGTGFTISSSDGVWIYNNVSHGATTNFSESSSTFNKNMNFGGFEIQGSITLGGTIRLFKSDATNNGGGFVQGNDEDNLSLSGGMEHDGTNWIARDAAPSAMVLDDGAIIFYTDSGLTPGNSFTPSKKLELDNIGNLILGGQASAVELRFLEPSGSGTNYTGFIAPALAGNVIYTLPTVDGTSGQQLSTNGSGVTSWTAAGSGTGAFSDAGDPVVLNTTTKNVEIGDTGVVLDAKVQIGGDADEVQLIIEGHLTQTDDIFIIQQDDETQVFTVSDAGVANALTLTESGNAIFNSSETPGGEFGGTWASPTIDDGVTVTNWALGTPASMVGTNLSGTGANFTAGVSTLATVTDNESTAEENPIVFVAGADPDGGTLGLETDGNATYNPSTGTITTTEFVGGGVGLTGLAGDNIVDGSVDGSEIDESSLVMTGLIDDDDLAAGAVDGGAGGEIADGTVSVEDLATNSVDSDELIDGSVDGVHIAFPHFKAFVIIDPVATDDYPLWRAPYAYTITAISLLVEGGTNLVGGLDEADSNGNSGVAIDADITGTAGSNVNDDGSLTNPTVDDNDYLLWHTTSISGTPTSLTVTIEYTID